MRRVDARPSPPGDGVIVPAMAWRWTRRGLGRVGLATGLAVTAAGPGEVAAKGGAEIVRVAKRNLNGVYKAGGTGKKDRQGRRQFDCSGFTSYCVAEGIGETITPALPTQARVGKRVSKSKMQPGDLMFFSSGGRITHCAIFMGNGRIIHAMNPQLDVKVSKLSEFTMKVAAVRRVG